MSATTETTPPPPDVARPGGAGEPAGTPPDPYLRGTDETVLLDLRELRAQQAAEAAARGDAPGAELETYQGSHRRETMLYAHGGTAIPLERVREVCHDLRQPVAAILMLASAAEMRPDVPERVRDVLQEIMTQTEDISATVRQFLDDAKQGVDGLGDPLPCNVAGLAAESVERWRATFSGRISLAAGPEPLHVTVDPVLFKRALGNVLSNGTRAAGGTGRVQVTVRRFETGEGERAVIEVDDSGPGFGNIPAGHGLGLAVVRRTVEAAGGSVEVAEGPLGGALIRMVLPVTPVRPLSHDAEMAKTVHGEVSLSALAEELAGMHAAAVDFDEVEFEDFDDLDDVAEVSGGHAFATRLGAVPEATAICGAPERPALTGAPNWPSISGMPEQATIAGAASVRAAEQPPASTNRSPSSDRTYSGPPLPTSEPRPGTEPADRASFDVFRAPNRDHPADPARSAPTSQPSATVPALAHALAEAAGRPAAAGPAADPAAADPTPQEPVRITATGQDDTALASIQLPSQAALTHPPRVPASALSPVAEVQLSLLPGGAF